MPSASGIVLLVCAMRGKASRAAVVLAVVMCVGGCSSHSTSAPTPRPEPSSSGSAAELGRPGVQPGERHVVEVSDAHFWEATVLSVQDGQASLSSRPGGVIWRTTIDRVHRLGVGPGSRPNTGEFAACRIAESAWVPCRVSAEDGDRIVTVDVWGGQHSLTDSEVTALDASARARCRTSFERKASERAFDADAIAAGTPGHPPAWRPLPGQLVVAWFSGTTWREARIVGVTPVEVELLWLDRNATAKRPPARLAPLDNAPRPTRPGRFCLVRQEQGTRWETMRVVRTEEQTVEVVDRSGRTRSVERQRAIALGG